MNFPGKKSMLLLFILGTINSFGQDVEMADTMRSEGKIYVVVAIILLILAGILAYLFTLDRKISGLEKKLMEKKEQ
jgi:hypothetical protein